MRDSYGGITFWREKKTQNERKTKRERDNVGMTEFFLCPITTQSHLEARHTLCDYVAVRHGESRADLLVKIRVITVVPLGRLFQIIGPDPQVALAIL